MRRLLLAAAAGALLAPGTAAGHVTARPAGIASGETETVWLEVVDERDEHVTTRLELALPAGLTIVAARAPEGWAVTHDARTATWTGGPIRDEEVVELEVRLAAAGRAGTVELDARQGYDDGAEVSWRPTLTVLPAGEAAPRQRLGRALVASVVGLGLVVGSVALLLGARRRDG